MPPAAQKIRLGAAGCSSDKFRCWAAQMIGLDAVGSSKRRFRFRVRGSPGTNDYTFDNYTLDNCTFQKTSVLKLLMIIHQNNYTSN